MEMKPSDPPPGQAEAYPRRVTLLVVGVLTIAGLSLLRAQQAVANWDFYRSLLPVSPLYLLVSGLLWGLAGLILAWGIWRRKRWAFFSARMGTWVYSAYYWFDRLVMAAEFPGRNWPFALLSNLILIVLVYWFSAKPRGK